MRNIKIILEYDGSSFFGFQRQPRHRTIQESLEEALSKLFDQKTKIQAASGRTDSGVHASHQVVNFKTSSKLSCPQVLRALNSLLPSSIAVKKVEEMHPRFHARYGACDKTYEYRIWNSFVRSPLLGQRAWHVPSKLNLAEIRKALRYLKGRKDFKSFSSTHGSAKTTIRRVKGLRVIKKGALLTFRITADGFLYHMVRNIVGTLVEVGKGRMQAKGISTILASRDRQLAGPKAPAQGLVLVDVRY